MMIMTWIYRAIALLVIVFTVIELIKEDKPSMKINAAMVILPLILRVLMIK